MNPNANWIAVSMGGNMPTYARTLRQLIHGNDDDPVVAARRTRLLIVQLMYDSQYITEEEALSYLVGAVNPHDMSTYYDDSNLLKRREHDQQA